MNIVALTGRLTAEPELKTTTSGTAVLSFRVAVDRNFTPKGQERQADFINCVAWRQTADFIARYFHKGQMIALTGEIQTRTYEDRDGNTRYATEVLVSNVSFCGNKDGNGQNTAAQQTQNTAAQYEDEYQEEYYEPELPF